jgi:hypothetical protein
LEHGDRIFPGGKVGIIIVDQTECIPSIPMLVHSVGTLFCNSGLDALVDNTEIRAQSSTHWLAQVADHPGSTLGIVEGKIGKQLRAR